MCKLKVRQKVLLNYSLRNAIVSIQFIASAKRLCDILALTLNLTLYITRHYRFK
ncbi:unnamed protein product [Callosobruchus maculatus]|uniref:Uncharacterized protein n=1 Tax=Callosobruchus maculatus TaxID=64391 RepID=A0A653CQF7_CALMS|nr:unnamed protein product [Callosobruchus maculatus]